MMDCRFRNLPYRSAWLLLALACAQAGWAVTVTESQVQDKVLTEVRQSLKQLMPDEKSENITVQVLQVPSAPFEFPGVSKASQVHFETRLMGNGSYSERGIVRVRLQAEDGSSREVGVPVRVIVQKPVWVAKHAVAANQPLRLSDFMVETRDISTGYADAVGADQDLSQYSARVNLRAGEILNRRKIEVPPDVACNEAVRILISSNNGMTLSVPGVAMSNGYVGEMIRVRQSVYQKKYYTAKIIDKNRVLVEM